MIAGVAIATPPLRRQDRPPMESASSPSTTIGPLGLVEYPHPALRRRAKPLVRIDTDVCTAVERMFDIMYEAQGVGLAANQVALPYRLFIVNCEIGRAHV